MKKLFFVLILSLFAGAKSEAGFLIDPYFDYAMSGSASFYSGASMTGNEIGARLGWDFLGLGLGIDYLLSGSYTYSQSGTTTSTTPSNAGVFIAYKFPVLVRVYASYFTSSKEKLSNGDYFTGTGTKIGFQYTGLPVVALGVESFSGSYNSFTSAAAAVTATNLSYTTSHTYLTISAPFSF